MSELAKAIEVVAAKNGNWVLKKDGRWLSSSIDPVREAHQWLERSWPSDRGYESAILVGLASGYHYRALRERHSDLDIVVLEQDSRVIEQVLKIHADIDPQDIIDASDINKISSLWRVQSLFQSVFGIFVLPSVNETEWLHSVVQEILGRDSLSFLRQLRGRPELMAIMKPEALASVSEVGSAISIKTISSLFDSKQTISHERKLWKILEELVR